MPIHNLSYVICYTNSSFVKSKHTNPSSKKNLEAELHYCAMKQQPTVMRPTLLSLSNDVRGVKEAPVHSHRAGSKSTTHVTLFLQKLETHLPLHGFISQKTVILRWFGTKLCSQHPFPYIFKYTHHTATSLDSTKKTRNSNNPDKYLVTSLIWHTYFPSIGHLTVSSLIHMSRNKCSPLIVYVEH